mmetsp:Transcript_31744/g.67547  ORF Transcript_31744/g.67547 Transcript_31744/m.67547 type:complete len:716 (+) Transcript_31744:77-2224(+)
MLPLGPGQALPALAAGVAWRVQGSCPHQGWRHRGRGAETRGWELPTSLAGRGSPGAMSLVAALTAGTLAVHRLRSAAAARRGRSRREIVFFCRGQVLRAAAADSMALSDKREAVELVGVSEEENDEADGPMCSIWIDRPDEGKIISEELIAAPWAKYMDKVVTIAGPSVRRCQKGAKQVATLGPASSDPAMLERLFLCGVDVFRLNFSHGEHSEKTELIRRIRSLEAKYKHPICILADMQGPKQRCGKFADPTGTELVTGQRFRLDLDPALGDNARVQLPHPEILMALGANRTLLLDDGKIRMRVLAQGCTWQGKDMILEDPKGRPSNSVEECPPFVDCQVEVGGRLSARKGVNTPDVVLAISPITPKDRADIEFACRSDVDWIALSFVQKHEDMIELRELVASIGGIRPKLLAKIEKPSAVQDLERILKVSDGVMVARGDLGVEMNPEEVPFVQKDMINSARAAGKPVIVATQMLESMISSPTPTRAECSDVANAILDGCDAVMLSGETAVGQYPTECVEMQRRVVESAERPRQALHPEVAGWGMQPTIVPTKLDPTNAMVASAATLAQGIGAKAIICFTASGRSVQQLVQLRPSVPILAVCSCLETARWLSLLRGVYATSDAGAQALAGRVNTEGPYSVRFAEGMEVACRLAREKGLATRENDSLVILARLPLFTPGTLNCIRLASALGPGVADGYGPGAGTTMGLLESAGDD